MDAKKNQEVKEMEKSFIIVGYGKIIIGLVFTPIIFIFSLVFLIISFIQKKFELDMIVILSILMVTCIITFFILLRKLLKYLKS